jgi:hypothetical protein
MEHQTMGYGMGYDRSKIDSLDLTHEKSSTEQSSTEQKFECGVIDKKDKSNKQKYCFETFEAEVAEFDCKFSEFLNTRYKNGWEYEDCYYSREGDKQTAYCLFEED